MSSPEKRLTTKSGLLVFVVRTFGWALVRDSLCTKSIMINFVKARICLPVTVTHSYRN